MSGKIKQVFKNLLVKNFYSFSTIYYKFYYKYFYREFKIKKSQYFKWLDDNKTDYYDFMKSSSESLFNESLIFKEEIKLNSNKILKKINQNLGGGAIYPLLYFLTRFYKPAIILETGVGAGFSSYSFLSALNKNKKGLLYSSDLPYVRIKNPENYVGIVVPKKLKMKWKLYLGHDFKNIPLILKDINKIDFFHYDSDKLYMSREKTFNSIKNMLSKNAIVMFDDIQDNSHFFEFVKKYENKKFKVFEFGNKYVGIIFM